MSATVAQLRGKSIVAGTAVDGTAGTFRAVDPTTGEDLEPAFETVDEKAAAAATCAAREAFETYRVTTPEQRAEFLVRMADEIDALGDLVVDRACAESGLPRARITGELARTTGQLRLFADTVRYGAHQGVRLDSPDAERSSAPLPAIRQRWVPLGPVVVFGASNFPLAFSTAGGDTASALAAGCPVVVKAHNAHPGTAELVGAAVTRAVTACDLHPGTFSLLYGIDNSLGVALVTSPDIDAVGFTGSRGGGLALLEAAARRDRPIPVFAEMSSINPVCVLPGALLDDVDVLATQYVASLTLGAGQFCTNPGLIFVPEGADGERFLSAAAAAVSAATGAPMLTPQICTAFADAVAGVSGLDGVETVTSGEKGQGTNTAAPVLLRTTATDLAAEPRLQREMFGAAGLAVTYGSFDELVRTLRSVEGQLTATIRMGADDDPAVRLLLPVLEQLVGRILVNGWPTGVEVDHAMVHGGPFPATSDARTTSVGTLAIERFQRPISYQNVPEHLLPPAVQQDNPWRLPREVDGRLELP